MLKELKEVNKFVSTRLYRNERGEFDKLIAAFEKAVREDAASKAWKKLMEHSIPADVRRDITTAIRRK